MYALWIAKLSEDPSKSDVSPTRACLGRSFLKEPLAGNAHFAKFVANMSSSQRAALYLVYGEGASYDEAAEVTALTCCHL